MIWLRSAAYNLFFVVSTFLVSLWGMAVARHTPAQALALGQAWARANIGAVRWLCGVRLEVRGLEHVPAGAALLASRHQSAFDTLVWLMLLPRCSYVLKAELLDIPLFGRMARRAGMIPVERSGKGAALRTLMRLVAAARDDGRQVVIFPEGTRAGVDEFPPLQPGIVAIAAHTGMRVIPVRTDSGRCWGPRAFLKRPGVVHIEIGAALPADLTRKELLGALEQAYRSG